jgi:hypothetical protein
MTLCVSQSLRLIVQTSSKALGNMEQSDTVRKHQARDKNLRLSALDSQAIRVGIPRDPLAWAICYVSEVGTSFSKDMDLTARVFTLFKILFCLSFAMYRDRCLCVCDASER